MIMWRVAKTLDVLLDQINRLAPKRSKASDGSVGDASHASRGSDHNPWVKDGQVGVVTARDFTHDPSHGFDAYKFADMLKANADPRLKYLISNRRIWNPAVSHEWRHYTGANPHNHHTHVSVKPDKAHYDSPVPWRLDMAFMPDANIAQAPRVGSVKEIQELLKARGFDPGLIDGKLGPKTQAAIRAFQEARGLVIDGKAGQYTWNALRASVISQPPTKALADTYTTSAAGRALIKEFEGCVLTAHQVGGLWHIGIGHSVTSGRSPIPVEGMTITEREADSILAGDLKDTERAVAGAVNIPITQGQFDALVSITFNKGEGWFRKSALLAAVNGEDLDRASLAILSAVPGVTTKFYNGIFRRRLAEAKLFKA